MFIRDSFHVWLTSNLIYLFDMKKEEIIRRCYGGMKESQGVETIILFHVGDSFEAYFDDAETISRITEVPRFKIDVYKRQCITRVSRT